MPKTTVAPEVGTPTATWKPSRKWGVAQFAAAGTLATMYVTTGAWNTEESLSLIGWIVAAGSTYLIPNAESK